MKEVSLTDSEDEADEDVPETCPHTVIGKATICKYYRYFKTAIGKKKLCSAYNKHVFLFCSGLHE